VETRELRYFIAVAEESHVGRASQRLGMAQPPLSRAIAQLERRMGAPLFVRSPRGMTLTTAGQTLLREGRAALAAVEAAERAPQGEVLSLPGDHYAPFGESFEVAVGTQLEFIDRSVRR